MAHFAELDNNNMVLRVLVVPDEQEHRGQQFLADDLNLGGRWIQTSYNGNIRGRFAGPGYNYDPTLDIFISPQPASWYVLDGNHDWFCPTHLNPSTGEPWTPDELLLIELENRVNDGLDLSQVLEAVDV